MSAPIGSAWERAQRAVCAAFGALLFFQSLALLFANRDAFVRLGFPDGTGLALGGLEAAASLLLVIPKTFYAGAIGLVAVLAWAAGFHFGIRRHSPSLFADPAVLALLLTARALGGPRRQRPA